MQKIKYDRKKNKIEEDEIYEKSEDDWEWIAPKKEILENNSINLLLLLAGEGAQGAGEGEILGQEDINLFLGKFSDNPAWLEKKEKQFILLNGNSQIELPEKFLSLARTGRDLSLQTSNNFYVFTFTQNNQHWFLVWTGNVWVKMNSFFNKLILFKF